MSAISKVMQHDFDRILLLSESQIFHLLSLSHIHDKFSHDLTSLPTLDLDSSDCIAIATALTNLRLIDVSFCPDVSETPVQVLLRQCRSLHTLRIRGNPHLTDKTMVTLVTWGRQIRAMDITECPKISDFAIGQTLEAIPDLRLLANFGVAMCLLRRTNDPDIMISEQVKQRRIRRMSWVI